MVYYVRQNADAYGIGSEEHPFSTIGMAAEIALPGDTILIGNGIYREWVSPPRGGDDENTRITYSNLPGEQPVISGAEILTDWKSVGEHLYQTTVSRDLFGDYCPYETEIFGDWYAPFGQIHHTGEIFANGSALYESASLEHIANDQRDQWFSICDSHTVTVWVYMRHRTPDECTMELSVRPFAFFPQSEKINYITVSGLIIENVATQWAPPTAFQAGAIGPHWSKGWIIENCTIRNSKCVGISLGKRKEARDNLWTRDPSKGGAQTYTEVIFTNLHNDWSRENVGSHIIRNNTIYNCGQAGIVGCMGGVFSTIEENHIYNINTRGEFGGEEVAGIKLHAAIDVLIRKNIVHDTIMALWLDWEAQGARVTRNIFFRNTLHDLFIEVCHGPTLIDHNLLLSNVSLLNNSQGTAFTHNLMTGATVSRPDTDRFTMYHFPHETAILGSIIIYGGDDKIYNNLYIGNQESSGIGNAVYNTYNDSSYHPDTSTNDKPTGTESQTLGMSIAHNAFFNGAQPCAYETDVYSDQKTPVYCRVVLKDNEYLLESNLPAALYATNCPIITSQLLGVSFDSGAAYENRDGTPLCLDTDFKDDSRCPSNPCGPFAQPIPQILPICKI